MFGHLKVKRKCSCSVVSASLRPHGLLTGIKPGTLALQADALPSEPPGKVMNKLQILLGGFLRIY